MTAGRSRPFRVSVALCVIVFLGFREPNAYGPQGYYAFTVIQFGAIALAAWQIGAWAIAVQARRMPATAGTLLFTPFVLFSFLCMIGAPGAGQNRPRNSFAIPSCWSSGDW